MKKSTTLCLMYALWRTSTANGASYAAEGYMAELISWHGNIFRATGNN